MTIESWNSTIFILSFELIILIDVVKSFLPGYKITNLYWNQHLYGRLQI